MKKIYLTPEIIEIELDNNISLQLATQPPTSNPRENMRARSNSAQADSFSEENPYQYENW
ncbi:MAG: hypothetical protein PHG64_00975 [Paludibacter sp.]|nr:hypothetical protein [Paludibacter sp.]